jgi:exodeoxyribonuclease VII small subunit
MNDPEGGGSQAPKAMSDTQTYESAVGRVEEVIRRLDSGEAGLRETLDLVREGRELVEYCAAELDAVSQGLEELRLEELVARLETGQAAR